MNNDIYVLTVEDEFDNFDMYFTTLEKAQNFIINNFAGDNPRRLTNTSYESRKNSFNINNWAVDQERL